jgi:hypothetical protein
LNGVLLGSADYTATNGTTVVLTTGALAGNLVTVESFLVSSVLNAIPNTAGSVSSANIANDVTINFADGSASTPSITNNGDTNTGIFFPAADTIAFSEGGAESMRIDSSGNVGIGTSSPAYDLQVSKTVASGSVISNVNNPSATGAARLYLGNDAGASTAYFQVFGSSHAIKPSVVNLGSNVSYPLVFDTAGTERMRITSGGDLCVGKTALTFATPGVVCYGAGELDVTASGQGALYLNRLASNGEIIAFYREGALVGTIGVSGSATSYNTSSDYRLKENIAPMTGALAKVELLKPVTYDWKTGGSSQGFIAHELAEVCPDAVTGEKDAVDEDGNIKPQGIDTSFLVATLTAAIQELKATVDAQALEIAALKDNL